MLPSYDQALQPIFPILQLHATNTMSTLLMTYVVVHGGGGGGPGDVYRCAIMLATY